MACPVPGFADEVVYQDDFSGLDGFSSINTSGSYEDGYEDRLRDAHSYMSDTITGGDLILTVLEDKETLGFDKKPGVLALSFDEIPETATYSGFTYNGTSDKPLAVPVKSPLQKEALKHIKVSFKHRAINKTEKHVGLKVSCRFEVNVDDAFETRIEFGELESTGKWQTFEITLDKGTNHDAFLKAVNAATDPSFKLAWSQNGEIKNYQNGDALLIDDLKISMVK